MGGSSSPQAVGWVTGLLVGPMVLFLIVFGLGFVLIAGVVYAGLCAVAGGLLLLTMSRTVRGGRLAWVDAYRPVFFGYLVALLVDGVRTKIVTGSAVGSMRATYPLEEVTTFADAFSIPLLATLMDWLWPGIPVAMLFLAVQSPAYRSAAGVFRSAALSTIALPGSLLVPLGLLLALDQRWSGIDGTGGITGFILVMVVSVTLYAVVGSFLAGPVLRRALVESRPEAPGAPRRPYLLAMAVLAVCAATTWLVMFFVPLFDPYWEAMRDASAEGGVLTELFTRPGLALAGLATFALLQAPGVWAGARVGRRLLAPSGRSVSEAYILRATAAAVVVTWPLIGACAWILAVASR